MSDTILNVADRKQLFIDRRFIDSSDGITLAVNPPEQQEIVLRGEGPWERAGVYATISDDGGKARLYYNTHVHGDGMKSGRLCYAESADGIHFEKPALGLYEWEGSRENNIVFPDVLDATPFLDPAAPAEERWKLIYNYKRPGVPQAGEAGVSGICLATSADGLHWNPLPERMLPLMAETHKTGLWDADLRKYVVFLRVIAEAPGRPRAIGRIEMDDITRPWPFQPDPAAEGKHALYAGERTVPMVFSADDGDPPDTDFYTSAYVKYPWAQDVHLMFPTAYRHTPPPVGVDGNDGPLATQFACSRDGIAWDRPDRRPYLRPGVSTEFDRGYNMMIAGLVRRGDWLYQYYVAKGGTHHGPPDDLPAEERAKVGSGCYVRARQRLDGFMSADAAYAGGAFTTPLLQAAGNRLELNIDTEATGTAVVELLDEQGNVLPGYGRADCDVIGGNDLARAVTWKGKPDLPALDRPLRLRFIMRSTKLYAFQFVG
ncbi:MAG: glycoside hydrolase family protein [Armatimonadota bacterium]